MTPSTCRLSDPKDHDACGVSVVFGPKGLGGMGSMAAVKGRRHRTGVSEQIPLKVRVSPDNYEWVQQQASALGISMATYVDLRLSHERAQGGQATLPFDLDEEAPLKSA